MPVDEVDYKGMIVLSGFIGAHILAGIYDGDLLKVLIGADIVLCYRWFGIKEKV